jgi:hypothetical protein
LPIFFKYFKFESILFIFTIPKFFFLATTFSQKLLSRISFRGFKQFDFLTRDFHTTCFVVSLINISGSKSRIHKGFYKYLIFSIFPDVFLPYRLLR